MITQMFNTSFSFISDDVKKYFPIKKMWSRPITKTLRSGFEITGYAFSKSLSTWSVPASTSTRSGFEITGYVMNRVQTWSAPMTKQLRSGFEVTGYALNKQ